MTVKTIQRLVLLIAILGLIAGAAIWAQQYQLARMAKSKVAQADLAKEQGDFAKADGLYKQHLAVVPDDIDTNIKYADMLGSRDNISNQQDAIRIYTRLVERWRGRHDLVRKRMDLEFKMKNFRDARSDLSILLPQPMDKDDDEVLFKKDDKPSLKNDHVEPLFEKDDIELLFKMGRCCEEEKDDTKAARYYRAAIKYDAPEKLEAYRRLASLLLKLKKPGVESEADKLIDEMVSSDPQNYKVYLERGRYLSAKAQTQTEEERGRYRDAQEEAEHKRAELLKVACADYRKARDLVPGAPEVILELAQAVAAGKSGRSDAQGRSEARQILENGLKAAPKSAELYEALANLDLQDGQVDNAIATLERGLKARPESISVHAMLAEILADQGDTGKLLLHIEELKKLGFDPIYVRYLMAYYDANLHHYQKARQTLVLLLAEQGSRRLAAPINLLLARIYSELDEPQMQQEAFGRALAPNSGNVRAKLGYIKTQIQQGDLDGAIEGYRELVTRVPELCLNLASLLIARNRQQPTSEHDWSEVEDLVEKAAKAAPDSVAPVILRAELILAQDRTKTAEAREIVREARKRFPKKSIELWNAEAHFISGLWDPQADPIGKQRKVDEALAFLKEAERQLGDSVALRLQRARLWAAKAGPQVAPALDELARNAETFSKPDRHKLLSGLAGELFRRQDYERASQLWSRLAEDEPDDIGLRRRLFDLALRIGNKTEIEKNIAQIERIEGGEKIQGRYCEVQYNIWQIDHPEGKKTREELRTDARGLLTELRSRRPDWSLIPLTVAALDEQELIEEEKDLDEKQEQLKKESSASPSVELTEAIDALKRSVAKKKESVTNSFIEAINLGERNSEVVRRVVKLLFDQGKANEALALFNRIPVESQLAGDLGRRAAQVAIDHQDFQRAEEIARKTVAANPGSLKDRLGLVQILRACGHQPEAEQELKAFVALGKDDPDRWIALVWWYVVPTKQPEKAEQAIREAEKSLPQAKAAIALAQCCEFMADYGVNDGAAKAKWYTEAENWYEKDRVAHPDDLPVARRLADFFIRKRQFEKAESLLRAIRQQSGGRNSDMVVWANRMLALVLASGTDPKRLQEALTLVEPRNQVSQPDPEDVRVLARVLEAQKTPEHRQRAIKVLQSLVTQGLATGDDRFFLAQLTEASGDWPRARELYRGVITRTDNVRDLETLNRWPGYLFQFANALFRHHQAGNDQDLAEVQDVIAKLKRLQPDSLEVLDLEVKRCQLQNQLERAEELIENFAKRPGLTPVAYGALAEMAAKLDRFGLVERLCKEIVSRWPDLSRGVTMALADFLRRRGQLKQALDLCEPLWLDTKEPEQLAILSLKAVLPAGGSKVPNAEDRAQLSRVAGWLQQALAKNPKSTTLPLGLGNLREQQGLYPEAEELYKQAITNGDREGISHNNLAWLMTLKDGKATAALEYVNKAIGLKGPTPDFLDTRGIVYLTTGDKQRAIKDLEAAVAGDRTPAKLFHLAQAYLEVHDKERAKRIFAEAKTKGLVLGTLHRLEEPSYHRVVNELGMK
jgi:tetratricopeptide (TPR) repeat protein